MGSPSLLSDSTETGWTFIFVTALMNLQHQSSILACSITRLRCSNLTRAATGAMNHGLLMTASENWLINFDCSTILYTLWSTKFSMAADRRIWTFSQLALSVSSIIWSIASLKFTRVPATVLQTRRCSLVSGTNGVVSMFVCRSLETT